MSEKVSGTTDKIDKIITIGGMENEVRNLADALAADYQISAAPSVLDAAKRLTKESFSAIILDLAENGSDMIDILQTLKKLSTNTPVIVIGNPNDTRLVVNAIKAGAFDFVTRPYPPEKIKLSVHQALENKSLKNEIDYLRREQDVVYDHNRIIAVSPPMQKVIKAIKRLSQTDSTILVTGETGTGKSFLSGNIHFNSPRRNKPFVGVNCANIPETLLESELFGHAKGAFTGADKTRTGRFEQASGGPNYYGPSNKNRSNGWAATKRSRRTRALLRPPIEISKHWCERADSAKIFTTALMYSESICPPCVSDWNV